MCNSHSPGMSLETPRPACTRRKQARGASSLVSWCSCCALVLESSTVAFWGPERPGSGSFTARLPGTGPSLASVSPPGKWDRTVTTHGWGRRAWHLGRHTGCPGDETKPARLPPVPAPAPSPCRKLARPGPRSPTLPQHCLEASGMPKASDERTCSGPLGTPPRSVQKLSMEGAQASCHCCPPESWPFQGQAAGTETGSELA